MMLGKHKNATISFHPSDWQRALIEERAALSGHHKKDFIAQNYIYSNIVVVGKQENIKRIVDSLQEMQYVIFLGIHCVKSNNVASAVNSIHGFLHFRNLIAW